MARRYSVEVNHAFNFYTVHHQNCTQLSRKSTLGGSSQFLDIGEHGGDGAALAQARRAFPKPWGCEYCCCFFAAPLEYAQASNSSPPERAAG